MHTIISMMDTMWFAYPAWASVTALIALYIYKAPVAKNTPPAGLDEASDW